MYPAGLWEGLMQALRLPEDPLGAWTSAVCVVCGVGEGEVRGEGGASGWVGESVWVRERARARELSERDTGRAANTCTSIVFTNITLIYNHAYCFFNMQGQPRKCLRKKLSSNLLTQKKG
jgi:hypothetical protein